ncbi:MAG: hypothetical protein K5675_07945 [Lachnospiraceae bacterium]|nr:hypothetical protein [Lachnospiraceae bacterium]
MKKTTGNLLDILKSATSIDDYFKKVEDNMINTSLAEELNNIILNKNLKTSKLFSEANIDRSYGYDILNNKKHPSRNKLLALLFAMHLSDDEVQTLLKTTGYPQLYAKDTRDSIILFAFHNNYSLDQVNDALYDMGFETLS